jgi:hypothetical protein
MTYTDAYVELTEPFNGRLPKGYALCCPHCEKYKAYPASLGGTVRGIKCAGPVNECGKFMSLAEARDCAGLRMVRE